MGVRVRVEIKVRDKAVEVPALVSSGYEAEGPEIAVPISIAEELGLWPPWRFVMAEADTAGGPIHIYELAEEARVKLLLDRPREPEVSCCIVVNPHTDEVHLCDHLIDALGIIVLSFWRGLWRHKDDPEGAVRHSEPGPSTHG